MLPDRTIIFVEPSGRAFVVRPIAGGKIFGGGGGGAPAQPTSTTVTNKQEIPEEFKPFFVDLFTRGQAASEGVPGTPFPGPFIPQVPGLQFEALGKTEDVARSLFGTGQPIINLGQRHAAGDFLDVGADPIFQAALRSSVAPTAEAFQRHIAPAIQSRAVQEGAFGGARSDIALGQAAGEAAKEIQRIASQLTFQRLAQQEGLQLQAPQIIQAGVSQELLGPQLLQQVSDVQRAIEAEQIAASAAQFQEEVLAPFRPLDPFAQLLQGSNLGFSQQGLTQSQFPRSSLPGILGGGALGGLAGAGIAGLGFFPELTAAAGNLGLGLGFGSGAAPFIGGGIPGLIIGSLLGSLF